MKDKSVLFKSVLVLALLNCIIFQGVSFALKRPADIENISDPKSLAVRLMLNCNYV